MRLLHVFLVVVVLSACTEGTSLESETTTSVAATIATTTTEAPAATVTSTSATTPTITIPDRSDVFVFRKDTLCDWFTTEEMDEILSEAIEASRTELEITSFEPGFCTDTWTESFMAGPEWTLNESERGEVPSVAVAIALSEDAPGSRRPPALSEFHGSPLLNESVTYAYRQDGLFFANGVQLYVSIAGLTDDQPLWFGLGLTTYEHPVGEDLAVAVLDGLLRGMGWTTTP